MSSSYGTLFRVTTFGESHGPAVGVVVDGCPPRLQISEELIQKDLDRRKPGQSSLVTQRREDDVVEILSGVQDGLTLGTPIALLVRNVDHRSRDYEEMREKYRPSHADFAYDQKYGIRAWSGGGRASARETVSRVAAGAIARYLLSQLGVSVVGYVQKIHTIQTAVDPLAVTQEMVEATPVRCPEPRVASLMIECVEATRKNGDSVGGVVQCVVQGAPAGWGEPIFDKLEAELAKAVLSIPACKGFEVGSGFAGTDLTGIQHNDEYEADAEKHVTTRTNNSGGIQGGISNGMPIVLRAAFKPTATVMREQHTVTTKHENTTVTGRGRHDACVLPRAVPIVEAMVALVLADFALRQEAVIGQSLRNP